MKIAIIGAGMAGLSCGEALQSGGHAVSLFDKGRAPGGRMSTRRMEAAQFDHGAQYFTARDPAFQARVEQWRADGLVARWPAAGPDAWVGAPAMNAPIRQMAEGQDVRWSTAVERMTGQWRLLGPALDAGPFDAAILAIPAEQAAVLLGPLDATLADRARATPSAPCWTVMAAFAERLPIEADILREQGMIGWAARDSAKPGRSGPESWVIQAGPAWSAEHLEDPPEAVLAAMLRGFFERAAAIPVEPLAAAAHRWRYARCGQAGEGAIWNPARKLGICGDWLLGPRVECAWLSGQNLARAIG